MMPLTCLLAVFVAFTATIATPTPRAELVPLESLPAVPQGWHQGSRPPAGKRLRFQIALRQENAFKFEQHLLAISDPDHPKYGGYMSRDELKAMLRPRSTASQSVLSWLQTEGVPRKDIEDSGDWINFYVTTAAAERILNTGFFLFFNPDAGIKQIRTLEYSVPQKLHKYIHMIQPTTRFGQMRPQRSNMNEYFTVGPARGENARYSGNGLNATFCNSTITPQCLRDLYRVGSFTGSTKNGGSIGVSGFHKNYAIFSEFSEFTAQYALYATKANFTYVLINGGLATQNDTADNLEANLDVQYAYPLAYPTPGIFYSTGGQGELVPDLDQPTAADNQNEPFLEFLLYLLSLPDDELPTTLTNSYGENEQSVSALYANMTCSLFAQLGARGVSVLFASGDSGPGSACQTNDGKNATRFMPVFPATCPYLTSVGGTHRVQPEVAVPFSSGGFSDRFPRPAYQDAAVTQYLSILGDTWEGLYSAEGRGFPDVAAQASNFTIFDQGQEKRIGGTSAAAPVFAGIVSLLNSARLSEGRKPLGFLNPFIYRYGYKGLTDIVDGGSIGCSGTSQVSGLSAPFVPNAGWKATKGWDPVTGYGTPNFPVLLALSQAYGGNRA
ncbi:MAG: hypothetical protein Q9167_004445 [Letrouitia subvulpina]